MAGKILTDVLSTNDRGLIGFTETGEEIPLSAPEPGFLEVKACVGGTWKCGALQEEMKKAYDEKINNILKESEKYIYLSKNKINFNSFVIFQSYNLYTKRK